MDVPVPHVTEKPGRRLLVVEGGLASGGGGIDRVAFLVREAGKFAGRGGGLESRC